MDVYQRRRLVALSTVVGVFVIVVLAVASGGDDDEQPATTPVGATGATGEQGPQSLGKRDYIRQADKICGEAASSLENVDATDTIQAAQGETRIMSGQLRSLRALPPPNRDRQLANRYLRELTNQVEALRQRQTALERADDAALIEIDGTLATAEEAAQVAASEFGFQTCGNPEAIVDEAATEEVPVEPAPPVEEVPVEPAPPVEEVPVEPPPDTGGTDPDTGGVPPEDGSGGVSP